MSFYKIKEVAQIALNGAVDATEEIIDAGRKFYCSLHQNHPAWTVARTFSDRSIILRAIDQMCEDGGTYVSPGAPASEFTGGQCCDGQYSVSCTFTPWNADESNPRASVSGLIANFVGKVIGPSIRRNPFNAVGEAGVISENCSGVQTFHVLITNSQGLYLGGNPPPVSRTEPFATGWHGDFSTMVIDSVTRTDGQPDNCGNPPAEYPPEPDPSDNQLTGTVQVTNINNETYDYDVTVNRDVNNTINFPPTVIVNDVAITIDVTGIDVLDNNNTDKNSGNDESGKAAEEPTIVEDTVPNTQDLDVGIVTDVTEDEEEDNTIEYVITEITTFPSEGKTIIQSDSNDNDYFAGYFNWTTTTSSGVCRHTTEPIRKRLHIFRKPDWATGYRVYTVNRARINVTKFTQPAEG